MKQRNQQERRNMWIRNPCSAIFSDIIK